MEEDNQQEGGNQNHEQNKGENYIPHNYITNQEKTLLENSESAPEGVIEEGPDFFDRLGNKAIWLAIGLAAAIATYVYWDFLTFKKVFLFTDIGSDSVNIYYPWLIGTADYLEKESVMGWSFAQGLGQNLYPLSISDIFSNLLTICDKDSIAYLIVYMEVLKIILACLFFFKFLKEHQCSNFISILFSLVYAFCGYIVLGGCWTIFSVEALYIAIILLGIEQWLKRGHFIVLTLGICLMSLLQPFLLFGHGIFLGFYFCVRYFEINKYHLRVFSLKLLKTVPLVLLGLLLSAFQLLPDILQYLESPRVGGDAGFFKSLSSTSVFSLANNELISTSVLRAFSSDMLGTGINYGGSMNYLEAPLFYCGTICLFCLMLFFSRYSRRQKILYGIFFIVFILPVFFPYLRYMLWAFTGDYFRSYSLMVSLLLILLTAKAMNIIMIERKINLKHVLFTASALLVMLYYNCNSIKPSIDSKVRFTSTLIIISLSYFFYSLSKKKKTDLNSKIILASIVLFELVYYSHITVNHRNVITSEMLHQKIGYNDYTVEAVNYIKKIDTSFYRINKDYTSGLAIHQSLNDAKVQGYYSTPSYFSFNQKNYVKFLSELEVINPKKEDDTRWIEGLGKRPDLFSLVSGKYCLSKSKQNKLKVLGFDSLRKFGNVTLYQNRNALPFGFTYKNIIGENEFRKLPSNLKDNCLLNACVIPDENIQEFKEITKLNSSVIPIEKNLEQKFILSEEHKKNSYQITRFSENKISGKINILKSSILFFSIPYDEGWKATVDGKNGELKKVNCGLTGIKLTKGNHTIDLSFSPRFKNIGWILSIFAFLIISTALIWKYYYSEKLKTKA